MIRMTASMHQRVNRLFLNIPFAPPPPPRLSPWVALFGSKCCLLAPLLRLLYQRITSPVY